jgi:antitoxin HigA-1
MISGGYVFAGVKEPRTMSKSSTTTEEGEWLHNPHAGEILLEEFLKPLAMSQSALARAIGVPPRRINEIVLGKRAVTADTDLRLGRYFGLSDGFFLRLQADYDLEEQKRKLGTTLERIVPRAA